VRRAAVSASGKVVRQGRPDALLASYPLALYTVWSDEKLLTVSQSVTLPHGVALLYPEGGAIHAAIAGEERPATEVLSLVKTVVPGATRAQRTKPKIEDLFIYLLSEQNDAESSPKQ